MCFDNSGFDALGISNPQFLEHNFLHLDSRFDHRIHGIVKILEFRGQVAEHRKFFSNSLRHPSTASDMDVTSVFEKGIKTK